MMLDPEISRLVGEKLAVAFEEREKALGQEYVSIISDCNRRGMLHSSGAARVVLELHNTELAIRAAQALGHLKRVASALGIEAGQNTRDNIKEFLGDIVRDQARRLTGAVESCQPFKGRGTTSMAGFDVPGAIEITLNRSIRDMEAEIDLWISALERQNQGQGDGSTQINVSGSVGILQSGDYATATQTITLDGEGKQEIARALEVVAQALDQTGGGEQFNVKEVRELVRDCQEEIAKSQPNQTKMKTALTGIAATIQTSAALGPAYETLRGALALIGITLP